MPLKRCMYILKESCWLLRGSAKVSHRCTGGKLLSRQITNGSSQSFQNQWMRHHPDYRGCCWNSSSMTLKYVRSQEKRRSFQVLIGVNLVEKFGFESGTLRWLKNSSSTDETLRVVMRYVLKEWPSEKEQVIDLTFRDEPAECRGRYVF